MGAATDCPLSLRLANDFEVFRMRDAVIRLALMLSLLATAMPIEAGLEGERAPAVTLFDTRGQERSLREIAAGRPTLVIFWATWCPYCRALFPHIQSVLDEYGPDRLAVVAIDVFEDEGADPAAYMREAGYDFVTLVDGDSVAADWGVKGTPGLFLLDSKGRVVFDRNDHRAEPPPRPLVSYAAGRELDRREQAARIAPWWAAQLRRALRDVSSP